MNNRRRIVRLVNNLIDARNRAEAIRELSAELGVTSFVVFSPDAEAGAVLAAAGFPQTFPEGGRWRDFVNGCTTDGPVSGELPWVAGGTGVAVRGYGLADGSVVVLVGGEPREPVVEEVLLLVPLFSAALKGEKLASRLVMEATTAVEVARESNLLARRLDESRRNLQRELEARHATEQLLREREGELRGTVLALEQAREQLMQHARELEDRVLERTTRIRETVEELEAFSYSIAHDMRAPLRSMQSFGQLLQMECAEGLNEAGRDYLRRIVTSASRLDRLIQDVFIYSRVSRSEMPRGVVDAGSLLAGIIESYPQFQPPQVEIDVPHRLPRVMGNEAALTQCFSNLLGNAVKFVAPGVKPRIVIRAEPRGSRVRFWVEDNGIGIPEDHHERIFGIFQRLNNGYDGTGIGLAIVKKAIERMGGSLGLESSPGMGSKFWFELEKPG